MPNERLSMRNCREILRLHFECGLSNRDVARGLGLSPTTVSHCLIRAAVAGLGWPLPVELDDTSLDALLYPPTKPKRGELVPVDCRYLHQELRRKGVTLLLLWQEYKVAHPDDGYQYSRFCELYHAYRRQLDPVMRQDHPAGERTFTDFSGDGIPITNPATGHIWIAPLFVGVLGASSYTYAEAFEDQQERCWIEAHINAFEFYGGVTELCVPDNTKTAVTAPDRYEPKINTAFLEMARHYGIAILPARVRKPRDKAKVENAVLLAQRWILAALRNHTFFSLQEANRAIREKLVELNGRKFQKLEVSRQDLYETLDRPVLRPLPESRYEYAEFIPRTVNIDYHVEIDRHAYSVPYTLVRQQVEVRLTAHTVEVLFKGRRVASHHRSAYKGGHTTCTEHMPRAHREHLEWSPSRILDWLGKTGPAAAELAQKIMARRPHPELGYRSCLGLLRLGKQCGNDRLEAACARALHIGAYSYKSVQSILQRGLDKQPLPSPKQPETLQLPWHENLRGPDYYQ
ncbi:MAG: IS21 family transposase [Thermoleophilia bacterium]|nr:IS21 family transposase [Thermoleophilia bacterium]